MYKIWGMPSKLLKVITFVDGIRDGLFFVCIFQFPKININN